MGAGAVDDLVTRARAFPAGMEPEPRRLDMLCQRPPLGLPWLANLLQLIQPAAVIGYLRFVIATMIFH
jgi:hypothetical protein